jgi:hypothetical protein
MIRIKKYLSFLKRRMGLENGDKTVVVSKFISNPEDRLSGEFIL